MTYYIARLNFVPEAFDWKKLKKCTFLVAIVLLVQSCIQIQPLWNSGGQGHLVTLARGHMSVVCQHFQRASPLKLLGQFYLNFICSLVAKGERNYIYFIQVT